MSSGRILIPRRSFLRSMVAGAAVGAAPLILSCRSGREPVGTTLRRARVDPFAAVPAIDGRGATVHRVFPTRNMGHLDPFVLLDDFHVAEPAGFPDHPHRGFEAFTYMVSGAFQHKDNLGNDSIITSGGTQRFTSGRGARHSEMPAGPGENAGMQLWVNLPRSLKKMHPEYNGLPGSALPWVSTGEGVRIRTVVGEGSPVVLQTAVRYVDIAFEAAAEFTHFLEAGLVGVVYVMAGQVMVGETMLAHREAARVSDGLVAILGDVDSRVVFIAGRPHDEPIYHHGPFVD